MNYDKNNKNKTNLVFIPSTIAIGIGVRGHKLGLHTPFSGAWGLFKIVFRQSQIR